MQTLNARLPAPEVSSGVFGDFVWDPLPESSENHFRRLEELMSVQLLQLRSEKRWVVLQRIDGELRYYATPLTQFDDDECDASNPTNNWNLDGLGVWELGVIGSAVLAVRFAEAYLGGALLANIAVPRSPRNPAKPVGELLWPPIDPSRWREVACVSGRQATAEDVDAGRAGFVLRNRNEPGSKSPEKGLTVLLPNAPTPTWLDLALPRLAILNEWGRQVPVVVIQAEQAGSQSYLGLRSLEGGFRIRPMQMVELLDGPDERFMANRPQH